MKGLLTLKDPRRRPSLNDIVRITVHDEDQPNVVLAGAQIPVSRVRFPSQIVLSQANGVHPLWSTALARAPILVVQVELCSPTSCQLAATGVAKLLTIGSQRVRAAASLVLDIAQ